MTVKKLGWLNFCYSGTEMDLFQILAVAESRVSHRYHTLRN